jgi:hypothetical protein
VPRVASNASDGPPDQTSEEACGATAYGALPVMKEVRREAKERKIKLLILPTAEAIAALKQDSGETNAILHVTC